jgi:predicted N-acetyltransferase YhbS
LALADGVRAATLVIRAARPDEAAALTDLAMRSKAWWGYDAGFLARCREALRVKTAALAAQPHFVAERGGRLLGFYGFETLPEGVGLDYLFVEPDCIGQGVGRALWRHAVDTAARHGHASLTVVADPNAAGFYRRMGAEPAGGQASEFEPGRMLPVFRVRLAAVSPPPAGRLPRRVKAASHCHRPAAIPCEVSPCPTPIPATCSTT